MKITTPTAPKHLSAEARGWWDRIAAEYELDDAALLILESAFESFDRMREAQGILRKEGITLTDRFGQRKQHPATLVERDARASMLRCLKQLGLDLEPLNPGVGRPAKD